MGAALSFGGLSLGGLAATPEDEYWRARLEAMARVQALVAERANEQVVGEVERAALDALERKVVKIVGPVKAVGLVGRMSSNLISLSDSPEFGQMDGVRIDFDGNGALVVTTDTLMRRWLAEYPEKPRPAWTGQFLRALRTDKVYGSGINTDGFNSVADIKAAASNGASFAAAKLGRWGPHTDATPYPVLIVTVVKGHRIFIASVSPTTNVPEIPACAAKAASMETPHPGVAAWGPLDDGEALDAWRSCERQGLPEQPYFADLKREAQKIAERLARAK